MSGRRLQSVRAGDELGPWERRAGPMQLFLFSAATHNPHRIHYDREYAAKEGHPDLLVHGPLQGAWLHQFVSDWAGPHARVVALGWENRRRVLADQSVFFRGRVIAVEGDLVSLEVWEEDAEGQVLMPGSARVHFLGSRRG